jgi:uncharacterized membrane protein YhiD involved in acid resistance
MAVGFGYDGLAVYVTVIVVLVLVALKPLEERYFRSRRHRRETDVQPEDLPQ